MATSTCPKCNSTQFEMKEHSPRNAKFNLEFVQCASCGAVVGVMGYFNIGSETQDLKKQINDLGASVDSVGRLIEGLVNQSSRS
jgi:hypothetical protein